MGQIVFNGQKPKYCNLVAITTGSKKDYVIPSGEVWLIDSTNASKTDGTGKYDYYIKGDGSKTASQLAEDKVRIDDNDEIVIDNAPTSGSTHAVSSGGVYQAISGKQDVLTFDSTPTASSVNPVTSGGVKSALDGKADAITTYTKSEVNNLIVPANTEIVVVSTLPASGVANTIYRVAGTTSYSDYGWDGTQFVKLAEYSNAYDAGGALS